MAVNTALIVVIIIIAIAIIIFLYFYGFKMFKKSPATESFVKTERGVIYMFTKHGLCLVEKIEENPESGWETLSLRRPNGELLPDIKISKAQRYIINPGRPYETWVDLSLLPKHTKIVDELKREKSRGDYFEREYNLLKANQNEELNKRVEQFIKLSQQRGEKHDYYKKP